jgi:rhodanese-related sulfurtransferase
MAPHDTEKKRKIRRYPSVMFLLVILVLFSCSKIEHKSPAEIHALIQGKGAGNVVIVDVRSQAKYRGGHIAAAVNIPIESDTFERRIAALEKDRDIVFYCGTGLKTDKAAASAERLGFKKIHVMEGGLDAWEKAGLSLSR